MPVPKLALAALGLGAVAFVATRKPKKTTRRPAGTFGGGLSLDTSQPGAGDHPMCKKYPGGSWAPGHSGLTGYPKGKPGWNEGDLQIVQNLVATAVAGARPWSTMEDARKVTFELTRAVVSSLCPSARLPRARAGVPAYVKKTLAGRWMWQSVDAMVWQSLVGDVGGGN